jgi:long-chain acyl-CoA synthetase
MYLEQGVVVGNGKKFCSALIIPDYKNLKNKLNIGGDPSPEELAQNEKVLSLIQHEIDKVNRDLPKWETIKKYKILTTPFTIETGELTPKMSVKRAVVFEKYADLIDDMYS